MTIRIGKVWNETVWVNVGGRSIGTKEYVQTTIQHGVYSELEIIIIAFCIICIFIMLMLSFDMWRSIK